MMVAEKVGHLGGLEPSCCTRLDHSSRSRTNMIGTAVGSPEFRKSAKLAMRRVAASHSHATDCGSSSSHGCRADRGSGTEWLGQQRTTRLFWAAWSFQVLALIMVHAEQFCVQGINRLFNEHRGAADDPLPKELW